MFWSVFVIITTRRWGLLFIGIILYETKVGTAIAVKTYFIWFINFHCYICAFSLRIFLHKIKWGFLHNPIYMKICSLARKLLKIKHSLFHVQWILVIMFSLLLHSTYSPEPKAQVSFSDHNLYVVGHHCCRWCRRKLFTFSSSSPEPLGQFQPNLAQSILRWRGFKFVQMKGPALFQGEIILKKRKYIEEIKKIFSRTTEPISTKLGTKHPWV